MGGHEFEELLARVFEAHGFAVRRVGASGADFGADLVVERDGIAVAVQAKNQGARVGNDAVQQAVAGAAYYHCDEAMVVSTSGFTRAARDQAAGSDLPVHLWDRRVLARVLSGEGL